MKHLTVIFVLFLSVIAFGQKETFHLTNALVVGQLDKEEDRYAIEVNLTELLVDAGIKATPSLNVLKLGSDASLLTTDSIQRVIAAKGIDTYLLVSVRGYDRKYKVTEKKEDLQTALNAGNLFGIYREEIVSVSFEFTFYRNGQWVYSDIVKCGNVSNLDSVIKRFRKAVAKRIVKKWK